MRIDQSKILNPGLLRHQITWQRRALRSPMSGEDDYLWTDLANVKARVEAVQGRELERVVEVWAEARYRITQHYYGGLAREDRINWYMDGQVRLLDVLDIQDPPGAGMYQIILAKDHAE